MNKPRFFSLLLTAVLVATADYAANAQTSPPPPPPGPTASASRARKAVQVLARDRTLTADQTSQLEIIATETDGNFAALESNLVIFGETNTSSDVRREVRARRADIKRGARARFSGVLREDVGVPRVLDRMRHNDDSVCELAAYDVTYNPENNSIAVYPVKGSDVTREQFQANFQTACACGWQDYPASPCLNMTTYLKSGREQWLNP